MAVKSRVKVSLTGVPGFRRNTRRMFLNVSTMAGINAYNGAQHLLTRTRAVVPYKDGQLYDAAYAKKVETSNKKAIWEVGYDTTQAPHALLQHETPEFNHPTRGPSAEQKIDHFLSRPRDIMEKAYARTVIDDVMTAIKRTSFERTRR